MTTVTHWWEDTEIADLKVKRDHVRRHLRTYREKYMDGDDEQTREAYFRACGKLDVSGTAWNMKSYGLCDEYTDQALEYAHIILMLHEED